MSEKLTRRVLHLVSKDNGATWSNPKLLVRQTWARLLGIVFLSLPNSSWMLPHVCNQRGHRKRFRNKLFSDPVRFRSGQVVERMRDERHTGQNSASCACLRAGPVARIPFAAARGDFIFLPAPSRMGASGALPKPTVLPNNNPSVRLSGYVTGI